ncbi:50S ribosome-binding GTPase [Rhizoctonia solani]|uniref:50S ribosome-binding GTPase n=1 Tax=Rhizoctonia solani TaxID=456999 RepID=A0A8H8NWU5_9AGAM|nr:50S ribosome-binding GTPase [Rhizoctonia solani]QRW20328.1 50S ribosome-binding GTPase [Rhizoctonia solani]
MAKYLMWILRALRFTCDHVLLAFPDIQPHLPPTTTMFEFLGLGSTKKAQPYDLGQPLTGRFGQQARRGPVVVLVLGRSGAGKSYLIDAVSCTEPNQPIGRHAITTKMKTHLASFSGVNYQLIDTPGFDNMKLDDIEICARLVKHLRESSSTGNGVNGIIYIHQSGDPLRSESFYKYLTVISHVFLGGGDLDRLTVLVRNVDPHGPGNTQIDEEKQNGMSTIGRFHAMGARIVASSAETNGFINAIQSYASTYPILLPVQMNRSNIIADLESILQRTPIQAYTSQEQRTKSDYERKRQEFELILEAKQRNLAQCQDALRQADKLRVELHETEVNLRHQSQQMQYEYSSLRSELQLQENFEQSEIVQELEDINRHIDDISRSISAYLTDTHVRSMFGRNPAEVTSRDAQNLSELFRLLQAEEGKCSLVSSSDGKGLEIESFLDFSIRHMLCTLLVIGVFQPFHPGINSEQSAALLRAYEDIQKRESQTSAGKWRSSTFKSIYTDDEEQTGTSIRQLLHLFIRTQLNPLLTSVFGSKEATMDRQHFNQMFELVKRAWNWNSKLKGEVIVLGDFCQIAHAPNSEFDPNIMKEFEPQPGVRPTSVLGTIGIGLVSLRAVGGGRSPEETIICKTTVATDTLYV